MSKGVYIEVEECIGCESCVEVCPEAFGFDEESEKAYVIPEGMKTASEECIEEAVDNCPVECIHRE